MSEGGGERSKKGGREGRWELTVLQMVLGRCEQAGGGPMNLKGSESAGEVKEM